MTPKKSLSTEKLESRLNLSAFGAPLLAAMLPVASSLVAREPALRRISLVTEANAAVPSAASKINLLHGLTTSVSQASAWHTPLTPIAQAPATTPVSTPTATVTVTASEVAVTAPATAPATTPATTTQPFQKQLFNSLIYANMPANTPNMVRLDTNSKVWFNPDGSLNQASIQQYARSMVASGTKYIAIDIEDPNIDLRNATINVVNAKVQNMIQIVTWLKQAAPGLQVGAYGFPFTDYYSVMLYAQGIAYQHGLQQTNPDAVYWGSAGFSEAQTHFTNLQKANDALKPLLAVLDFAAPDLYTHVDLSIAKNMQDWDVYAAAAIEEARRVMPGKPILPFLQPQYTPELGKIASTNIPATYWRQELQTVWNDADGAIVWGGWNAQGTETWDPSAGWYSVIADGSYKN